MMKHILEVYEAASGQAISLPKSEVYYSRSVPIPTQEAITTILGVRAVMGTGKYLGLPSMIVRSKEATFSFIKDRVWHKINSWSSKCLSKAGREVLIKSLFNKVLDGGLDRVLISLCLVHRGLKMGAHFQQIVLYYFEYSSSPTCQ